MNTATALYKALHKKRAYTKLYWDVANTIGIHQALLVEIVERWCELNQEKGKTNYFQQGEWWTSATYQEWAERYPALGGWKSIQRIFLVLEKENYILSGKFTRGSQTKYYRVNPEAVGLLLLTGTLEGSTGIVSNSDGTVSNSDGTVSNSDGTVSNSDVLPYIDQIIQEDHSQLDHSSKSPCSPPRDMSAPKVSVEVEILGQEKDVVDTSSFEDPKELPLLDENSNPGEDKNSARRVATKDKVNCDYQVLVDLYNEYKPPLWRKCQLTSDREKALKRQFNQLGDKLAQAMIDALKWAESDEFWSGRKGQRSGTGKKFDLDSLFYQNRVQKWAGHLEEDAAEEEFKATHHGYTPAHVDRVHRTLANIADL